MARGGRRAGAGRRAGSANRRSREIANHAAADGITPLEYMLRVLRDPQAEPKRRDEMARAAAPFLHSRFAPREEPIRLPAFKGSLTECGSAVLVAIAAGTVTPMQAAALLQTLAAQARIIEIDDFDRRLRALEENRDA